ncbi:MAG: DUF3606 domain-containing protein [Betaproteobacteria bacterium]
MEHRSNQRGLIDKDRIASDWQIGYWAMKLGKSEDMIEDAIDAVGDRVADVRQYFFCGPQAPVVKAAAPAQKPKAEKKVRQPIFDWLCSPSLCGLETLRMND